MTLSAGHWRARRVPGEGAAVSQRGSRAAQPDQVGASARQQRRHARADRAGVAAAVSDRFLDVIVMASVLVFVVLVMGFGLLVLQSALQR